MTHPTFTAGPGFDTEFVDALKTILASLNIRNTEEGALVFLNGKSEGQEDIDVTIMPLYYNKNILDAQGLNNVEKDVIFRALNSKRMYSGLWYSKIFKDNYEHSEQLTVEVPDEYQITYDSEQIIIGGQKTLSWKQLAQEIHAKTINHHVLDQLNFDSGCNRIWYVPLPVLSTPMVLLVLNAKMIDDEWEKLLRQVYFRTRDVMSKNVYTRLIDAMDHYIKQARGYITEHQLVEHYAEELSHIFLPISYQINGGEIVHYFSNWPQQAENSIYKLSLLTNTAYVEFQLTTFKFIDFEHDKTDKFPLFHQSSIYKATLKQSTGLISKLFDLIFSNLQLRVNALKTAYEEVLNDVDHVLLERLEQTIIKVNRSVRRSRSKLHTITEGRSNCILITEKMVSILLYGEIIFEMPRAKNKKAAIGFTYIAYLIMQSAKKKYSLAAVEVKELYHHFGFMQTAEDEKEELSNLERSDEFQDISEELESIGSFWKRNFNAVMELLKSPIPQLPEDKEFKMALYHVISQVNNVWPSIVRNPANYTKVQTLPINRFRKLAGIFKNLDPNFQNTLKEIAGESLSLSHKKLRSSHETIRGLVRYRMKAAFTMLERHRDMQEQNSRRQKKLDMLLNNFATGGLKSVRNNEVLHQDYYGYSQTIYDNNIDWDNEFLINP